MPDSIEDTVGSGKLAVSSPSARIPSRSRRSASRYSPTIHLPRSVSLYLPIGFTPSPFSILLLSHISAKNRGYENENGKNIAMSQPRTGLMALRFDSLPFVLRQDIGKLVPLRPIEAVVPANMVKADSILAAETEDTLAIRFCASLMLRIIAI